MSRFQRMIVIPEEEYRQILSFKTPTQRQFFQTQQQLEEQSHIKDPYSRLLYQGTTLDLMKSLKERMKRNIATSTPKPFRGRANQLYSVIEPYINFNDRGEILDDSHRPIVESHIEDLIQYAVRNNRRNIHPRGWSYFLEQLRHINVPKVTLNRETIKELNRSDIKTRPKARRKRRASMKTEVSDADDEEGEEYKQVNGEERMKVSAGDDEEEEEPIRQRLRKGRQKKRYSSFYYY